VKKLIREIIRCMDEGMGSVLCTVIASSGSTPRGAGARMLVTEAGRACGTIGGGAVEYKAEQTASEILASGKSLVKAFDLSRSDIEGLGMICGGSVRVFFQFIAAGDKKTKAILSKCLEEMERNSNVWLVTDITDEAAWGMGVICDEGILGLEIPGALSGIACARAVRAETGGRKYYSEPVCRAGRVIVFGGGHVAQELVPVLSHVGFYCVVVDDRPEFASVKLFPAAERVILGDFLNIGGYIDIGKDDYVVIMTRGHAHDYTVEEQVLRTDAGYVGMIGSKKKIAAASERLLQAGLPRQKIDSVYAPIGVKIKAETPAEIAISVAGELIRVRAERLEGV
jgi:xanthine dehydrogenase accessory factor